MAGVEHDDGIRIDGGHLFDQPVLITRQGECRCAPRPHEHNCGLGRFGRGDRVRMILLALLRRVPVESDLSRRMGRVRTDLDLDGVCASGQRHRTAHVVQSVGGGHDIVLIGLQDVAMHIALIGPRDRHAPAVDIEFGVGAQGLEIDPVDSGFRHSQGPVQTAVVSAGKALPPLTVKFTCGSIRRSAPAARSRPRRPA